MKQFSIVGQKHRGLDPYLAGILPGVPVTLVREPGNKYDPNAVMVWIDGKHVGYIPSKTNAALAQFIDQTGAPLTLENTNTIAMDSTLVDLASAGASKTITGTFARSQNSAYPQVTVSE
jgi:HIRAN domain